MKKEAKKSLIAIFLGLTIIWAYFDTNRFNEPVPISSPLLEFGFGSIFFIVSYITLLMLKIVPQIVFQILYGTYIYKHFCVAHVYYFSRQSNRLKWLIKESTHLLLLDMIYHMLYIIIPCLLLILCRRAYIDNYAATLFLYIFIYEVLYTFIFTMLLNILAVFLGSQNSFLCIYFFQFICAASLLLYESILSLQGAAKVFFMLNPISNMLIAWHSTSYQPMNQIINILQLRFDINQSIIYFIILSIAVILFGYFAINRTDISLENKEAY